VPEKGTQLIFKSSCVPFFVRREVLDRLLTLNHQRYAVEVKDGLHEI